GGVWKTTNCCSTATSWTVTTDDPLISDISIDSLTIDPNNHNTIYAGTGDLNYGTFSMGSQGILKSTDGGVDTTGRECIWTGPVIAGGYVSPVSSSRKSARGPAQQQQRGSWDQNRSLL